MADRAPPQLVTTISYPAADGARRLLNIGWSPAATIAWVAIAQPTNGDAVARTLACDCQTISVQLESGRPLALLRPPSLRAHLLLDCLRKVERDHASAVRYAYHCLRGAGK